MQHAELTVEVVVRCPSCKSGEFTIQRRQPTDKKTVECVCHCQRCSETFQYTVDAVGKPVRAS